LRTFDTIITKRSQWIWIPAFILFAVLKIWLVGDEEITARYSPYDQSWFMSTAHHLIQGEWLGPYNLETLIRQPGYPLWIRWVHALHLPLRLGIELFLIASGILFAASLVRLRFPHWIAFLAFLAIVFHPASFTMNNESICETLYAPLLVISLSGLFFIFSDQEDRFRLAWAWLAAFTLALLWNTRHENFLIICLLAAYAVLFLFFRGQVGPSWRNSVRILLPVFWIFLVVILAFTMTIRWNNYRAYGLFETSEMFSSGLNQATRALLLLRQENPRRFVSVPKGLREQIYAVSPAFNELRPYLEGDVAKGWIKWGCEADQVCDDISNGWFIWALRDSVRHAGHYSSAFEADQFYHKIADEVIQACQNGKLVCRNHVLGGSLTFLHPYPSTYLKFVPRALHQTLGFFVWDKPYYTHETPIVSPSLRQIYDETAIRKTITAPDPAFKRSIQMWITRSHAKLITILGITAPLVALLVILIPLDRNKNNLFVLSLLFIVILPRILLVTLWKAGTTGDTNPRYVYSVMGLSSVFLILIFYEGVRTFARGTKVSTH
jgi:hypothetical protein